VIVDVNVSLSRWPFRRLRGDEAPELVSMLQARGVTQAWAGSFDGLLHKDIAGVNERLAADCARHKMLVPFGSVNPKLPDWEEDLRRCHEVHRMPGLRLHPNYHGYALDDPDFAKLLKLAAERRLLVQIALKMEDERVQHPLLRVPPVDASTLPAVPGLRVMLLNASASKSPPPGVTLDFAMLEGITGVAKLIGQVGVDRVVFGSHFPFFTWESADFKVRESALDETATRKILSENALRLLR
jgi:predicted TIM-barrel fold metal-dependent hydrolase